MAPSPLSYQWFHSSDDTSFTPISGATGSPPGTYPTTCSGAASATYALSYVNGTLTITQGTVTIGSDPAKSQPKSVASTGGTASFTRKATEGDISTALPVTYTLTPIGPGTTYTCADSTGNGLTDGVLQSQCAFTGIAPNVYTLTISAGGNCSGTTADTVTVVDEHLAFVVGSGTLSQDRQSGTFQFNAEYQRGAVSGTFEYQQGVLRLTRSNLTSLALVRNGPNGSIAYLSGTATDQQGRSYRFRATPIDEGQRKPNLLVLLVTDAQGQEAAALSFGPVELSCGDIVIGSPGDPIARMWGTSVLRSWQTCR